MVWKDEINFFLRSSSKLVEGDLVRGLNLNDKRWLDTPDYAGRLETFVKIEKRCKDKELKLYSGIFVVYNCIYTIKAVRFFRFFRKFSASFCFLKVS